MIHEFYNEMRSRGWLVDVGNIYHRIRNAEGQQQRVTLEIDFVCNKGSNLIYIQSVWRMPDSEKMEQEKLTTLSNHISSKFIQRNYIDNRKWMMLQTLEMSIIRNNIISSTYYRTIHKFIVILVFFYQVETEIWIFSDDISRTCQNLHEHVCNQWRSFLG